MKEFQKTLVGKNYLYTISLERGNHISVHDHGEPCGGILRHWGTKEALIKELQQIIKELETL